MMSQTEKKQQLGLGMVKGMGPGIRSRYHTYFHAYEALDAEMTDYPLWIWGV